jgi:hypothetical protein
MNSWTGPMWKTIRCTASISPDSPPFYLANYVRNQIVLPVNAHHHCVFLFDRLHSKMKHHATKLSDNQRLPLWLHTEPSHHAQESVYMKPNANDPSWLLVGLSNNCMLELQKMYS